MSKSTIICALLGGIVGGISFRVYEYYKTRKHISESLNETLREMKECNMFH